MKRLWKYLKLPDLQIFLQLSKQEMRVVRIPRNPVILQLFEEFREAEKKNRENLFKILRDNRNTEYGKTYGFSEIRSEEDYRRYVPLTEYSAYENMGQKPELYTVYPVSCTLVTSGTTGVQKEFCITEEALQRYGSYIYEMLYELSQGPWGPHLHMSVFRSDTDGKNLLSAVYYRYLADNRAFDCDVFVGGKELLFSDNIKNVPYVKAWLALSCPNLVSIQAIFLYDILLLFGYLEENWKQLLSDMKNGEVRGCPEKGVRERLLALSPSQERIQELEHIFSEGFEEPVARKIWKGLRFISGIGGKLYQFQGDALKHYTGDVPVSYFAYASSECMAGVAAELNRAEYALLPESGYYEFLNKEGNVVSPGCVRKGEIYELVVTTFSGLYRYQTGDLIKPVAFLDETPVFEVMGRRNQVSDIAGEKLSGAVVQEAVSAWAEEQRLRISDFVLGVDVRTLPYRYCLFVETIEQAGTWQTFCFDRKLRDFSPDYDDVRNLGMLGFPEVYRVKAGVLMEEFFRKTGENVHRKPHIFFSSEQTRHLLRMISGEENG